MSEKPTKTAARAASSPKAPVRFGAAFLDAVEREVELMDVVDFEEFLGSDRHPIEPSASFRSQLSGYLRGLVRARFTH